MITNLIANPLLYLLRIPGLLLALSMHEFAHGFAAYKMGDNTAKYNGRLSINPFSHLDPMGTLCLLLARFGWAKPVPINPYNFKNRRAGIITVSLAGPFMNFFLAFLSAALYACAYRFINAPTLQAFLVTILEESIYVNVGLGCFNLIPIPPLDGSKVLLELLPYNYRNGMYQLERYASIILFVAVLSGILNPLLSAMGNLVIEPINMLIGLIINGRIGF